MVKVAIEIDLSLKLHIWICLGKRDGIVALQKSNWLREIVHINKGALDENGWM